MEPRLAPAVFYLCYSIQFKNRPLISYVILEFPEWQFLNILTAGETNKLKKLRAWHLRLLIPLRLRLKI